MHLKKVYLILKSALMTYAKEIMFNLNSVSLTHWLILLLILAAELYVIVAFGITVLSVITENAP